MARFHSGRLLRLVGKLVMVQLAYGVAEGTLSVDGELANCVYTVTGSGTHLEFRVEKVRDVEYSERLVVLV